MRLLGAETVDRLGLQNVGVFHPLHWMLWEDTNVLFGRLIRALWSNKFMMGPRAWSPFEVHLERSFSLIPVNTGWNIMLAGVKSVLNQYMPSCL